MDDPGQMPSSRLCEQSPERRAGSFHRWGFPPDVLQWQSSMKVRLLSH